MKCNYGTNIWEGKVQVERICSANYLPGRDPAPTDYGGRYSQSNRLCQIWRLANVYGQQWAQRLQWSRDHHQQENGTEPQSSLEDPGGRKSHHPTHRSQWTCLLGLMGRF